MSIQDLNSRMEILEQETEALTEERESIVAREEHLKRSIAKLNEDVAIMGFLQNKAEDIQEEKLQRERDIQTCQDQVRSLESDVEELFDKLSDSNSVLKQLEALGEDVAEGLSILEERQKVLEECERRLLELSERLDMQSHVVKDHSRHDNYGGAEQAIQTPVENNIVPGWNQNIAPLATGDVSFCGLPARKDGENNWTIVSSCDAQYSAYREHTSEYKVQRLDPYQVKVIDARMVAGIDFISDRHINDPESFWNKKGDSFKSFYNIAQKIPVVQNRLSAGESLETLMADAEVGRCAELFFNVTSSSFEPIGVIEGDGFYEINGRGRHRIMLAQMLGVSIPMRVEGKYVRK